MIYKLERGIEYHLNWDAFDTGKVKRTDKDKTPKMQEISEDKEGEDQDETEATEEKSESKKDDISQEGHEESKTEEMEGETELKKKDHTEEVTGDQIDEKKETREEEGPALITEKKEDDIKGKFASDLMDGFKEVEIRLIPLSDDIEKLSTKKKFQGLFDVVANGFLQAVTLKADHITKILTKETGYVLQENAQ